MNTLLLDLSPEQGGWYRRQEVSQLELDGQRQVVRLGIPDGRWQKQTEKRLIRQIEKLARRCSAKYAVLGDALVGSIKGGKALQACGLSLCDGVPLHAPLYPMAVRKLAKESGVNLMERPVTITGDMNEVVGFIWRMKDEVKYFAVAGGAEYADLITYLYDEFGISVRLVEEAHSGICVAAGGQRERLESNLVLDFHGTDEKAIRVSVDMGQWSQWLGEVAEGSNLGVVEALLRMLGEQPEEALPRYCRSISLLRGKSVRL